MRQCPVRSVATWMLPAALALVGPPTLAADTEITVDGSVRVRTEVDGRNFSRDAATLHYTDLRSRGALLAVIENNTRIMLQIQDSRRLGGETSSGDPASGLLFGGNNIDAHQAYVQVDHLWSDGPGLQAGRFEVNMGNQRVFGAVDWHNVGRSWEGLRAWQDVSDVTVDGYWLKRRETGDPDGNRDFDVFGVRGVVSPWNLDLFAFLEQDASRVPAADSPENRLDRVDLGVYYTGRTGSVDVIANAAYQTGKQRLPMETSFLEQDLAAFLVTGEVGYTFPGSGAARAAAGFDFASGDDTPGDDTFKAYDNLYYTGHKFRGYMDYFLGSNVRGLLDVLARGSVRPGSGWTVKSDVHYFRTAVGYEDFNQDMTSSVGIEVDTVVNTTRVRGVVLEGGASLFLPSDSFAGIQDPDPGLWFYGMMTASVGEK